MNYWPASTGCNVWTAKPFPGAEIQHDLDVLAASPFNSLRIFIEWGALAPTEGGFDEEKFANLALMLGWIKQRGLLVDISTFMGWMSGRHYWPVLRLFPPCALLSHAQGSSGAVDNMPFAWRGHTKRLTTRARPSPDLAVWLE